MKLFNVLSNILGLIEDIIVIIIIVSLAIEHDVTSQYILGRVIHTTIFEKLVDVTLHE